MNTDKLKKTVDEYFENTTAEEVCEKLKYYGCEIVDLTPTPTQKEKRLEVFCKEYKTEEHGQIVVIIDRHPSEDMPCINIKLRLKGALADLYLKYDDTEEGWNDAEGIFESYTMSSVVSMVSSMKKRFKLT